PSFQLVREKRGETRVPSLRETRRDLGRLAFIGIEVDFEVLRFQHLEVERFVLHLVAAEVLRIRGRSMEQEDREHEEDAPSERSGCERHAGLPSLAVRRCRIPCPRLRCYTGTRILDTGTVSRNRRRK